MLVGKSESGIALKACPFCGGEADLCVDNYDFDNERYPDKLRYVVECKECLAQADSSYSQDAAIENWNKRV